MGETRDIATLPMFLGGLGVRSALRTSKAAHWASWADCLPMILERHPDVARLLVGQLEEPTTPCFQAVAIVARDLTGVCGFEPPSWRELAMGARPEPRELEDFEPGCTSDGWQHEASARVEETFRVESLFPRMEGGPGTGLALSTCPVSKLTSFTPQLFRVILLRRLHLPLPLTVRNCQCGLPLDSRGHHRAACARFGVLGRRGWAVENTAGICREAGGRVTSNVMLRDLDLVGPHVDDGRRLEVIADGLPLFGVAQLAVDTTLVSALRADGLARRRAAQQDGVAAEFARQRKVRTFPELVGPYRRAHLVVLALEVTLVERDASFHHSAGEGESAQ